MYWLSFFVVLVAFLLSFFLKAAPLRQKSALQENAEAAVAAQRAAEQTGALVAPDLPGTEDSYPKAR